MTAEDATRSAARAGAGLFGGFALLAMVNAVAIAVGVPWPLAGGALRLEHHLFDVAETLGVGAVVAGAVSLAAWALAAFETSAGARRVVVSVLAPLLSFAANVALVWVVVGHFLRILASHGRDGQLEGPIFYFYLCLAGGLLAVAPYGYLLVADYPRLRGLPIVVAAGTMVAVQFPLRDDYEGAHCLAVWGAVLLAAPTLAPLVLRAGHALARSLRGRVVLAAIGLACVVGVVVVPPDAARFELFRQPCALAPWVLATLRWPVPRPHAPVELPPSPWLAAPSAAAPPVPPTEPAILPPDAVVVFITIDAFRADVLANPDYDARFPTFARLKKEAVVFTNASSAAGETVVSLTETFASTYFSQQRWSDYGTGAMRFAFPHDDPGVRFPELLSSHGVDTAIFGALPFFRGDCGMARGFREDTELGHQRVGATGARLVDALLDRLNHAGPGPLFLYTHLLEPHAPYGNQPPGGTNHERYLAEVQVTDRLVARVLDRLETKFGKRWALFISADHGEAFGEHGMTTHAKSLYQELLHVPLLARSPSFAPRTIEQRVGLIDIGPTMLDLFRVPTPGTFEGQSLAPLLAGKAVTLTRPLLAEGRLRRALTEADGLKVILDPLRKVVEVYDLTTDPGETRNLFDVDPSRSDRALATLQAFFDTHTRHDGGYVPPYVP